MSPRKKKKPTKGKKKAKPLPPLPTVGNAKKAAAIVSQVLIHFGSGYRPVKTQIFQSPADAKAFSDLLMRATMKNLKKLKWDTDTANRDAVCATAFKHGGLCRDEAKDNPLTWEIIKKTLPEAKRDCPGGAGGGLVCTE